MGSSPNLLNPKTIKLCTCICCFSAKHAALSRKEQKLVESKAPEANTLSITQPMRFVVGVYSKWIINTKLYAIWFTHKNDIVRGLVCRVINITHIPIEPFVEQCLVMVAILDLWSTKTENFVAYHSETNTVPTNTNMHVLSINKRWPSSQDIVQQRALWECE
jgi:hypothetical protein